MSDPHDPPIGALRWPRDRWISPTALSTYALCPYRIRLQHIDGIKPPWAYQVTLSKGRIAHNILRDIALLLKGGYPVIDSAEMLKRAKLRLPPMQFPTPEAREAHASDIVRWVNYGVRYLESIPNPQWLVIEKNQSRRWPIYQGQSPYTLMARPDVVLQRTDEDGSSLVEIIDYKTGQIRPETDPPILMRFVAHDLLRKIFGDASVATVRFTYLWLDHADRTHIDLSVDYCNDHWKTLTRRLHDLANETEWAAKPTWLCRYCPYHQNVCREVIPLDEQRYDAGTA